MERVTERQREVLKFLHRATEERGFPPTIVEIGDALGISSTNGVYAHLQALLAKGYLKRTPTASRSFVLTDLARYVIGVKSADPTASPTTVAIPVLGKVAAGAPILAVEEHEDSIHIDACLVPNRGRQLFALRVKGESMIGDGINDGDYLFVRTTPQAQSGQIVVALIDEEATCKRYYPEGDTVRFQPSNPRMVPLLVRKSDFRSTMILGVVVGIYRQLKAAHRRPSTDPGQAADVPPSPTPPSSDAQH